METTLKPDVATHTRATVRIQSLDIVRGIVMVLMAIDHVRVYSGLPAGGSTTGIFFTRWITHFCAPAFVFLAGTSAFLYARKIADKSVLTKYLVTRGLLLVVLELTVIRFCWTFSVDYSQFVLAGVIWMLGWCMILLAVFIRLKPLVIGVIGFIIVLGQQLFAFVPKALPTIGPMWEFIYPANFEAAFGMTVLYVLVPWLGVMLLGYAFGEIMSMEPERRKKLCLTIGLVATGLWLVVGTIFIIAQPASDDAPPFVFQLLNQRKYPASQLYLLMTLGPVVAFIPTAEKMKGKIADFFNVIGQVPLFYYLLHIPLIHVSALIVQLITTGSMNQEWYLSAPYVAMPEPDRWSLAMLYLVFVIDVSILYFACRWYASYKQQRPGAVLLKYI